MSVVPLLALAGTWQIAVVLIIAERIGKGVRNHAEGDQTIGRTTGWRSPGPRRATPAGLVPWLSAVRGAIGWAEHLAFQQSKGRRQRDLPRPPCPLCRVGRPAETPP
jgi:hypothetical protein